MRSLYVFFALMVATSLATGAKWGSRKKVDPPRPAPQRRAVTPACVGVNCVSSLSAYNVQVSQKMVDYMRKEVLDQVIKSPLLLQKADSPDRRDFLEGMADSEREKSAFLAGSLRMEHLYMTNFDVNTDRSTMRFKTGGIDLVFVGIKVTMQLNVGRKGVFANRWSPRVAKVIVSDATFGVDLALGKDANGRPTVSSVDTPIFELKREHFDIQWLSTEDERPRGFLNWVIDRFEGLITRILARELKKRFNGIFNPMIANILKTMPTEFTAKLTANDILAVATDIVIQSKLNEAPASSDLGLSLMNSLDVAVKGDTCDPAMCPIQRLPREAPSKFVNLLISDHVMCCMSRAAYQMGYGNLRIRLPQPNFSGNGPIMGDGRNIMRQDRPAIENGRVGGQCINGRVGTCKCISDCRTGTPVSGGCLGGNDIKCCPNADNDELLFLQGKTTELTNAATEENPITKAIIPVAEAIFKVFNIQIRTQMLDLSTAKFKPGKVVIQTRFRVEVHLAKNVSPEDLNDDTRIVLVEGPIEANVRVFFEGNTMKLELINAKFTTETLELVDYTVDAPIRNAIDKFQDWLMANKLLKTINDSLKAGEYTLPSPAGITFVSPEVSFHEGYIKVATDLTYRLPRENALELLAA